MVRIKYFLAIIFATVCHCSDEPHVKTPLGEIKGTIKTSHGGRQYSAFEGIPFAKPPIGYRRFEEPEPVEPWSGVWEANFLTQCVQTNLQIMEGLNITLVKNADEDCLHINVYVPRDSPKPKEKLDVIVHVHGGAYMYGSGHIYANPQYLMDHDVIFVTFNYRLGIMGFLSTEDDVVPGNNGMKDQVMALKWIQQNIASFGGNPESVTLTGGSAGAASVHLHYFSDMSKGLFHRGYSLSGVALNSFSLQEEPLNKAKILAEAVGCPTAPNQELVRCLKQRPYHHLLNKMRLFFIEDMYLPIAPFAPVVEKGTKPFLKADPYHLLITGKVHDVPWIVSNTVHEGFMFVPFWGQLQTLDDKWEDLAPFLLDYNYTLPRSQWKTAANKIREYYLSQNRINEENLLKLVEIFSDRVFLVDAETAVREQAKVSKSPVYYYLFNYPGDDNEVKFVGHGADIKYLFGDFMGKILSENELKMKDVLVDIMISYARTGKPSIKGIHWEPTSYDELTHLKIDGFEGDNIKLMSVKELTPRAFWKSLRFQENENLILSKDEL